jgi:MSHA biogenesis protein MshQ
VSLTFTAGSAAFSLGSSDVGKYALNLRDDSRTFASGVDISGTTATLTVRPFGLTITGIQSGATVNPGGTATTGARFTAAGENFSATVTSRLWQAADDANNDGVPDAGSNLTDNGVTPSYRWATQLALTTPVTPVTGSAGTLGGTVNIASGSFAGGAATVSNLTYSEVGSMTLAASATGFLGTAGANPSGVSGVIGRFYPDHFALLSAPASTVTPACVAGGFSYMGHAAIGASFSIEARNRAGARTTKYNTASYTTGTVALVAENNNDGTDRSARLASLPVGTWVTGTYAINTSTLNFTRGAAPDGPFAALDLGVRVTDPDGALLANRDMNPATSGNCVTAANCNAVRIGSPTQLRFGRLYVANASGTARLDLPVRIEAQYYTGTGFLINAQDSCTSFAATAIALGNYTGNLGPQAACKTALETPAGTVSFTAGAAQNLKLRKPGTANAGSVDLRVRLDASSAAGNTCTAVGAGAASSGVASAASLGHLRGNWAGTGTYDQDPSARATFGVYKNASEFIYFQENF